ncbi:PAS domain S-box protein [Geothrix sp. PMB-07]|uniref:PAS domain S-box protein n=1 Tax=Geothrix sp. PMB-07 TaxID=3068640 RepID=UPI0027429438|nr:PAS domain S-box protein [Geothrix sp. PMB-07]WLT31667.1 PAS domain S-box protein [Geothrix sp. PMB-07]
MVQFNTRANEILLKLVYYGPGLSGKTTNLQSLHAMCSDAQRGEMFSVNTQEDRTLFFDLLPINLGYIYGNAIHLQIYTVPGQVQYDASRRVVLGGADGVVFVADSSEAKMQDNVDSLSNLYHNLNANRLNIKQIPFVIQYNKRDLPDALAVGVMNRRLNFRSVPYFESVANRGTGVLDTFLSITRETVSYTFKKYHLDKKIKDFDEMLNLIESNVRSSMRELPQPQEAPLVPPVESTVLRHSNVSVADLTPGKVADAQDLLEDALKSNMETARLYSELKQVKDTLEKKNEELSQLYTQLDRANQDNLKTRRYLEGLVQNIGEAVISYAPDGKILTWNMAAERIFGYSRPEIVGRNMAQLTPDHLLTELDQVAQQVGRGQVVRDMATTRLRKGGVTFPANITYAPVRGNDERVLAYSALVRDVSEHKELQEQLVHSQKHEALGRLVPSLFHEAANRLTPVLLESRLIAESSMDPHQAEQAARLVKAVDSIQSLLHPLQTVLNPPSPRPLPVRVNDLVQEATALVDAKAQRMGASVELNLDPALPQTALDPGLLVQALTNLLLNGLQAMALSPIKRLRVATRVSGETLQVVVQDTGPAVGEARQAELFDPAQATTTEALGLPIADIIARQHGGRISTRSQEGLGNAFLLELPLVAVKEPAAAPAPPPGLKGTRALVVDDESFLLECLVDALSAWGMEVESSPRGDEAIQKLEVGSFDVIVSDIRMPGLSGVDLFDWLKAQRPAMTRRILYTTGDSFDVKTREFLEASQVPYLGKPFDLKQLKQSLERLLETPVEA